MDISPGLAHRFKRCLATRTETCLVIRYWNSYTLRIALRRLWSLGGPWTEFIVTTLRTATAAPMEVIGGCVEAAHRFRQRRGNCPRPCRIARSQSRANRGLPMVRGGRMKLRHWLNWGDGNMTWKPNGCGGAMRGVGSMPYRLAIVRTWKKRSVTTRLRRRLRLQHS